MTMLMSYHYDYYYSLLVGQGWTGVTLVRSLSLRALFAASPYATLSCLSRCHAVPTSALLENLVVSAPRRRVALATNEPVITATVGFNVRGSRAFATRTSHGQSVRQLTSQEVPSYLLTLAASILVC